LFLPGQAAPGSTAWHKETAMSDSERRSFGSFLPLVALIIFLAPLLAFADPFLMLRNERSISPASETGRQAIKRSVTVGLNENGDLMIRHSDVSLILAYNPPNDIIDYQERIRIARRQDCPTISGISLKVSLLF
jgi:hypothetical protein